MDDVLLVGGLQGFSDLPTNLEGFFERDGATLDSLGEVLARDQLEDEERLSIRVLEPVDHISRIKKILIQKSRKKSK